MSRNIIISIISKIPDARAKNVRYNLAEIIFLTLAAVISKQRTWEDIEDFGHNSLNWLRNYFPYKNGIPSHDTISRVMGLIRPAAMTTCLKELSLMMMTLKEGKILQVDGKTLRGSAGSLEKQLPDNQGGQRAIHMLNLWCAEEGICLKHKELEGKQNEVSGIQDFFDDLEITGCTITFDAMFCQKTTIQKVLRRKANYLIKVKKNANKLHTEIKQQFDDRREIIEPSSIKEKGHGRTERRDCRVLDASVLSEKTRLEWPKIETIIEIDSLRKTPFKTSERKHYYISNLKEDSDAMAKIIRTHWSIENHLHRALDVVFGEDASGVRAKNAASNFSAIRKIALNFWRKAPRTEGIKMNRLMVKCMIDREFREETLTDFFENFSV